MAQATANFAAFFDGDSYRGRENRDTLELTGGAGDGGFHGVPCEVLRIIGHGTSDPCEFTAHRRDHQGTNAEIGSTVERIDPPGGLLSP